MSQRRAWAAAAAVSALGATAPSTLGAIGSTFAIALGGPPRAPIAAAVSSAASVVREVPATDAIPLVAGWCVVTASAVAVVRRHRVALPRRRVATRAKTIVDPGEKVVGIDLGTTNSAVAAMEAGVPGIIPNAEGQRTTPSVVAYSKSGELLVGQMAKRQSAVNPANTFSSVKRFVGREPSEVVEDQSIVSYRVETGQTQVKLDCPNLGRYLSPEDISAQVLRKLAGDASEFLKADVKKAVVTVPAYFNDSQRQATKDAGAIAGLEVLRIVNEPTAASLAYGLEKQKNETIMVFDLGGGTFDVSLLTVGEGVCEVLATSGDTHLGGDDFDRRIVDWLAEEFEARQGIDLREEPQALQRLVEAAEKAKIELSNVQTSQISLPFIAVDDEGVPMGIDVELSRTKFEDLCEDLIERCRGPVEQALKDAELTTINLDEVVLVGGSTRVCAVQALARQLGGGRDPNQSVNPDEVVAIGAAVQAGVLTGEVKDLVLLDVIPLSLSVATHDGLCSVFIPRNMRIPAQKSKIYSTAKDNQPRVEIKVVQGERRFAKDNKELGMFLLTGIPPSPSGVPQIEVTFDVDSNGILSVSAKDKATLLEQKVTITGSSTLAPEDVETKIREAKEKAAEEAALKGIVLVRNDGERIAYALERLIRDNRESLKREEIDMMESKLLLLRGELDRDPLDIPLTKAVTEDLREVFKEILSKKVKLAYDYQQGFDIPDEMERKRKVV
mmetsp:Transcript_72278/g.162194  ORF Transcript_72278/g.162194 Transcript_72278/m.162194 type:complete len:727 (+) Transcript_72278:3-2183(+)